MAGFDPARVRPDACLYFPRLRAVRAAVEARLAEPIGRADAAAWAYLSPAYFSTFFRRNVGVTFCQWLAWLRVERAKKMLERSNLAITEVALACGFRDLGTFERAFKRMAGTTPRAYKRRAAPARG